ncbi:cellulose binding domain-containing protein [Nonomuraea sp. NPDC046802]|uniref:cellulose binding domain-containing protein n=1 Tax=Nonomuraea sp. NPDC046802 TaxID=3154919 RepID=UPI00340F639F
MPPKTTARAAATSCESPTANPGIAPGASIGIGFQAAHTGNAAKPTSFIGNGAACTVA